MAVAAPLLNTGSLGRRRRVSFREARNSGRGSLGGLGPAEQQECCPQCRHVGIGDEVNGFSNGYGGGGRGSAMMPPVERAIVRTFSIDKLRPICPVCNPAGETPYPADQESAALDELHESAMKMLMNSTK